MASFSLFAQPSRAVPCRTVVVPPHVESLHNARRIFARILFFESIHCLFLFSEERRWETSERAGKNLREGSFSVYSTPLPFRRREESAVRQGVLLSVCTVYLTVGCSLSV